MSKWLLAAVMTSILRFLERDFIIEVAAGAGHGRLALRRRPRRLGNAFRRCRIRLGDIDKAQRTCLILPAVIADLGPA